MTNLNKLKEFRNWLHFHREHNMRYGRMEEEDVDEILDHFEAKFANELRSLETQAKSVVFTDELGSRYGDED